MKKILSLLLAVSIVSGGVSAFAAQGANKFTDISEEKYAWAKPYIEDMATQGYINGYEDNTYRPDNEVTRLETIVLFARAMGANLEENKDFLASAMKEYSQDVKATGVTYGYEEISYMLARGVLSKEDLKTYLSNGKASRPMPRQEACAIITKAMCGEEDAKAEVLVDLEYTDAKQISSAYSQYVFYASNQGIMNGMDDGSFGPENSVLRSQIAVMLSRTVDKMNLYIETVLVPYIDTTNNNISIVDSEQAEVMVGYTDNTKFYNDIELSSENKFVPFSKAMLTYINNELAFVDMYDKKTDSSTKGIYQGSVTENNKTTITVKPEGQTESKEYTLYQNTKITNESGQEVLLRNISLSSYIEYDVIDGKIAAIRQIKKESYISGAVVESVSIEDDLYLVISHDKAEYNGMKFALSDGVVLYKNNDRADLSKLYKGDRIDLTLEYGLVTKIVATSNTKIYDGTIAEVVISTTPVLKAKINGEIVSFEIVPSVTITSDGKEATLYDLRVGDSVKITTESGAVLKIVTTAAAISSDPMTGVVEIVNTSKGFIKVNGETIFCKDGTTTFISAKGTSKAMKDVKEGSVVSVRGSMQNGAYNASLVIIEE